MRPFERHDLVRPGADGWALLRGQAAGQGGACDALLEHWQAHRLPLIVAMQRPGVPPDRLCLGLPAPLAWGRRRLAFELVPALLADAAPRPSLPSLEAVAAAWPWGTAGGSALARSLAAAGARVRVHGAFGWQHLSGLACVRATSDLDLLLDVPDRAAADACVRLLQASTVPLRLDGELRAPDGRSVAWREWAACRDGEVDRLLVKCRAGVELVAAEAWLEARDGTVGGARPAAPAADVQRAGANGCP